MERGGSSSAGTRDCTVEQETESSPRRFSWLWLFSVFVLAFLLFLCGTHSDDFFPSCCNVCAWSPEANISTPAFFNDSAIITNINQKGALGFAIQGSAQTGKVNSTIYLLSFWYFPISCDYFLLTKLVQETHGRKARPDNVTQLPTTYIFW